jgi:hypothetical protein
VQNKEQLQQVICGNWRTIDQVNKEEEEYKDLGGVINPKKPIACSASLCRFVCLRKARKRVNYKIC